MKTSNMKCRQFVETLTPFNGSNLTGVKISDAVYAVYSYGWWPLWACIDGQWYGHSERYSVTTGRHRSQSCPYTGKPIVLDSCQALKDKINGE